MALLSGKAVVLCLIDGERRLCWLLEQMHCVVSKVSLVDMV